MALKGDRQYDDFVDISFFMNATGERGGIVVHGTSGSGAAMDQGLATVSYPTSVAGTNPAGLLLNDVVSYDLTRQHLNEQKDEVQIGSKVALLRRGWVVTNWIASGQTPAAGNNAWYTTDGKLRTTDPGSSTKVGRFLSGLDENGFAKVEINIV